MADAADHAFMARALQLAERGLWTTMPNPRVGCVLVREGVVVGEGWHERAGAAHAEVAALAMAGESARHSTAYVTLEPCSHHGRTPPCADALRDAGVRRVVAAMQDPNPLVAGRGLAALTAAGVATEVGVGEAAARALNAGFVQRMTSGRPWVRLKQAASLDGRTALSNGVSQWITGPDARADVHRWRARSCAMLTGSGTVLADDPQLTARLDGVTRQPLRVVVDGCLCAPLSARLLPGSLLVTAAVGDERAQALRAAGAEVLTMPDDDGRHVDLMALLEELGRRGCNEVMVEAGAGLAGALLQRGLVDEVLLYLAPLLLGDAARGLNALPDWSRIEQGVALEIKDVRAVGNDWRIVAWPQNRRK